MTSARTFGTALAVTLAFAFAVVAPSHIALAQPAKRATNWEEAAAAPEERVDVIVPAFGLGYFTVPTIGYDRPIVTLGFDVRYARSSGHGFMLRGTWASSLWGAGYGLDLDYLHRSILAGDQRLSLGLDVMVGATLAMLDHNESTVPIGGHAGANASLSLDFRVRSFIVSLGAQYRLLVGTRQARDGSSGNAEHVLTGSVGVGFTLY